MKQKPMSTYLQVVMRAKIKQAETLKGKTQEENSLENKDETHNCKHNLKTKDKSKLLTNREKASRIYSLKKAIDASLARANEKKKID